MTIPYKREIIALDFIHFFVKVYFGDLKVNKDLSFSSKTRNREFTHAYHRYPAKFIPALASKLILDNTKEGDTVCDPFGGCGTTLVEAKINGRNSIGIDINPVAELISKTKITPINPRTLNQALERLIKKIEKISKPTFVLNNQRISYWFDDKTLKELEIIYSAILEEPNGNIRRFFECAFSHILKNCSRWLMKSIKPTIDNSKSPSDPKSAFLKHLNFMIKQNSDYSQVVKNKKVKTKFYIKDARRTNLKSNSVDYILTSPPYVTSYEYADLHQLSLLWFESIDNWVNFKRKFIGTSHRNSKGKPLFSSLGDEIVRRLKYNDAALARGARVYYEDMSDFLVEAKRILKKNKKISLVIGNTILRGIEVLNAEVAYEQMKKIGFRDIEVEKRQTSSQSITPYRDIKTGRFTSVNNSNKKRAYEFEYIITAAK